MVTFTLCDANCIHTYAWTRIYYVCVCVCVCVLLVAQLCPTLCHPMDCSPPASSVRRISQARILKWIAIPFSRGSSQLRYQILHCRCILYCLSHQGSPIINICGIEYILFYDDNEVLN